MPKIKNKRVMNVYTDGGSRGNPGPSGVGAVLFDEEGEKVEEISRYIGDATNNVAEYIAVIYGVQEAMYNKADKVILNVDSQLVARQLKGEYRVKDQNIKKFFDITLNLFRAFDKVEIKEIPREDNKEADALANKALNLKTLI